MPRNSRVMIRTVAAFGVGAVAVGLLFSSVTGVAPARSWFFTPTPRATATSDRPVVIATLPPQPTARATSASTLNIPTLAPSATNTASATLVSTTTLTSTATDSATATYTASEPSATPSDTSIPSITPTPLPAYTVQNGDSLAKIARQFNVTVEDLIRVNQLTDANVIYPGQVLNLPAASATGTVTTVTTTESNTADSAANTATTGTVDDAANADTATTLTPSFTIFGGEPSATATAAPSETPVPSETPTAIQPSETLVPSVTPLPTETATAVPPSETPTSIPSVTPLPTDTPTATASDTPTLTFTPSATATPVITGTTFAPGVIINLNIDPVGTGATARELGVKWAKVVLDWGQAQPTAAEINANYLALLDAQLNELTGVNILLTVTRAPDWARAVNAEDGPPTDYATYYAFLSTVAQRYRGRVAAYEIWERPNVRREWNGQPINATSYVQLLRGAYATLKQIDPSITVVSAGLAPTGFDDGLNAVSDRRFLSEAYQSGLASVTDAIGAQPGGWANPPDSTCCTASPGIPEYYSDRTFYFRDTLEDYRAIMIANSDPSKFLWATSFGYGAAEGVVEDLATVPALYSFVTYLNQAQQAENNARAFALGRELTYVGPMMLNNLNACSVTQPGTLAYYACFYSLTGPNGVRRPAFSVLQTAISTSLATP